MEAVAMEATIATVSSAELAQATGLSYREVDYWNRRGVIRPDQAAHGSGTQRRYSLDEVQVVIVLRALRSVGMPLDVLARVAVELRSWDGDLEGVVFISPAGEVRRSPGGLAHYIDLDVLLERRASA